VESRKQFNTEEAIQECYGEDASMFAGGEGGEDGNNVLASAIDAMVDRINDKVKNKMVAFLEQEQVAEQLNRVEAIVKTLDDEDEEQKQMEAEDRQSAREALEVVKLPKNISPEDVIRYESYKLMEKERDALLDEIAKVEQATKRLNERIEDHETSVNQGVTSLQEVEAKLQESASLLQEESKLQG